MGSRDPVVVIAVVVITVMVTVVVVTAVVVTVVNTHLLGGDLRVDHFPSLGS